MPTKRKVTVPPDEAEYPIRTDLLSEEELEKVEQGVYYLQPGKEKPVIRWVDGPLKGRLVTGTGVPPKHKSLGAQSRETAWKRTAAYKDLMELRIPAENEPERYGSFAWLLDKILANVEGGDVEVTLSCPHCGEKSKQKVWKKGDANAGIKLVELFVGRATETKDVSMTVKQIYEIMDERVEDYTLHVTVMDEDEIERRKQIVEAAEVRDLDIE